MPDCGNKDCRAPLPAGFTECKHCHTKYDKREPLTALELTNQEEDRASVPVVDRTDS